MSTSLAQIPARELPDNDPARAAILASAVAPAEKELGQSITLQTKQLRVLGEWAFVHAAMHDTGGKAVSYSGTRYQEAAEHGHKSDKYAALLKRSDHGWHIEAYAIGPTDVAWQDWPQTYGAPQALFDSGN